MTYKKIYILVQAALYQMYYEPKGKEIWHG